MRCFRQRVWHRHPLPLSLYSLLLTATVSTAAADGDPMQRPPWAACEYCHGQDGNIDSPSVPAIAGQDAAYIRKQLADFRAGRRTSPERQMSSAVALLEAADDATVANHFASRSPMRTPRLDRDSRSPGAVLFWQGNGTQSACVACHAARREQSTVGQPFLPGLSRDYLVRQLRLFRSGKRNNDADGLMRHQARRLDDDQIAAIADYLAGH